MIHEDELTVRFHDEPRCGEVRSCSCGRGLPLLDRIEGREADYVVTPAGTLISGISLTENFALLIDGTAQVQIVQESVHDLRIRLVAGARHQRGEGEVHALRPLTLEDEGVERVEGLVGLVVAAHRGNGREHPALG